MRPAHPADGQGGLSLPRLIGSLLLLLLAGCATRPLVPVAGIDWDQREQQLLGTSSWRAQGRIAVKSGTEGGQGNLVWTQAGSAAHLSLSGPFGAGAYEVDWDDENVIVYSKAGEVTLAYEGPDAVDRFIAEQVGWPFPARSMRYWIMGVADPAYEHARSVDESGWLADIEQNGWRVTYSGFASLDGRWLPRKIITENADARIKLVVDRWSF